MKVTGKILSCHIMRFEHRIAHNSVSTNNGVQRPQSSLDIIAEIKMCVNKYDAKLSTDRLEF
jgi:hypothetical protein